MTDLSFPDDFCMCVDRFYQDDDFIDEVMRELDPIARGHLRSLLSDAHSARR